MPAGLKMDYRERLIHLWEGWYKFSPGNYFHSISQQHLFCYHDFIDFPF